MVLVLVVAAAVLAVAFVAAGRPVLAALAAGLGLGPAGFFAAGILIPRHTRQGHFYSFPFGGIQCGDRDLSLSLLTWVLALGTAAFVLARLRSAGRPEGLPR